ncbi:hypothetical protein JRO89_XS02G0064500 [Xanthoceras sorbifolium]|uniref:Alpha/beta hydrolase fold-3 domain-containing protein n=1 Tax=Xanthoceras sorbifolium TaxID=99658 RepID=A0ABQ8IF10_9ROSI|nr:hypothetical protein JRO89_XS02G0064500 [Xanthoceras sorbifolium]
MDSPNPDLAQDFSPLFQIYKDGRVDRLINTEIVPPSFDPKTTLKAKTFYIHLNTISLSGFTSLKTPTKTRNFPFLFTSSRLITEMPQNTLYRLLLKIHGLPSNGLLPIFHQKGPEDWLNHHANFQRVFLSGGSAGGNMHTKWPSNLAMKRSLRVLILQLKRLDDPWINPAYDPNLGLLGCSRVQVAVSEKDPLRERGWYYCLKLRESGWSGDIEVLDYKGEEHVFHYRISLVKCCAHAQENCSVHQSVDSIYG